MTIVLTTLTTAGVNPAEFLLIVTLPGMIASRRLMGRWCA